MKEQILALRAEGKTYKEIIAIVGCSKSTVCYYCGLNQKDKAMKRADNNVNTKLGKRANYFKAIKNKADHFGTDRTTLEYAPHFGYKEVLDKFGENTICYLTGRPINLMTDKYHFDHIIPFSKSNDNSIDNLGIACAEANMSKSDLSVEEFISLCKEVLTHNGYTVTNNTLNQ